VAAADWLHPPEVVEVDLEAWTGGIDEKLRAKVRDDVILRLRSGQESRR